MTARYSAATGSFASVADRAGDAEKTRMLATPNAMAMARRSFKEITSEGPSHERGNARILRVFGRSVTGHL